MIELLSTTRCIGCDRCVDVCPTDVFDRVPGAVPVIARQGDCQTCFLCEAWCPVDALWVAAERTPLSSPPAEDEVALGSYREALGWGQGRTPGARIAIGPPLIHEPGDPPGPPLV